MPMAAMCGSSVRTAESVAANGRPTARGSRSRGAVQTRLRPGQVIAIVDVVTGVERALAATSVQTKTEGRALTPRSPGERLCSWYSWPDGRNWDYEGWSWSPDGTSIVFLETHGERPKVVNVETGEMAELPWEADALPTWQRVLPTGPG